MPTTEYGPNGYIGQWLCDGQGFFETPPALTLHFTHSFAERIPGVTITWSPTYDEWAASLRVTAYHGERVIFMKTISNTALVTPVAGDISGYDKIVVEVLSWCKPYRRARVENLFLGLIQAYGKEKLMSYSASMAVDPLSAALPKSEISFSVSNLDGEYNPDNPHGAEKYLMERQEIIAEYGFKLGGSIQWIPGGTYYLNRWETPQNGITASFSARDAIEFLSDPYTGPTTGTLLEIAQSAFEQAGLPPMPDGSPRWYVDSSLGEIEAAQPGQPQKLTIAQMLQYIANAGRCVFYQDRAGKVRIEPLQTAVSDYSIDPFNSYANSEISLSKPLKAVDVNNGSFILTVGKNGETQPINNPFLSTRQAPAVSAWAAEYLENRRTLTGNFRADPRLDPLDLVTNENQFARSTVLVTEVKFTYNGAFRGSYKGRGMNTALAYYYYAGDLYSGEV